MCWDSSYDGLFDSSRHHRTNSVDEAGLSRQTGTSQKEPELGDSFRVLWCHRNDFLPQLAKKLLLNIMKYNKLH